MLKKIPLTDWASPASGEQLLPGDYRPSNKVATARRAKPINNSQKLDPPTMGRATKLPMKPSKPMTTAIIQVTFFGAERFILILLVVQILKTLQRCNVLLAQIKEYKHIRYNNKLCKKLRIQRTESNQLLSEL